MEVKNVVLNKYKNSAREGVKKELKWEVIIFYFSFNRDEDGGVAELYIYLQYWKVYW